MIEEKIDQCYELKELIFKLYSVVVKVEFGETDFGDWFYINFSGVKHRLGMSFDSSKNYIEKSLKYMYPATEEK